MIPPISYVVKYPGVYSILNDDGEYMDNLYLIREPTNHNNRFRYNKKHDVVDMWKRKHNKKILKKIQIRENSINNRVMVLERVSLEGSERAPLIHQKIFEKGEFRSEFKMSHEQAMEVRKAILETLLEKDDELVKYVKKKNFGVDTLICMSLLKNPDYMICAKDLLEFGVERINAHNALKRLESKGILKDKGKISRRRYYTCVIPKKKLAEMFSPVEVD